MKSIFQSLNLAFKMRSRLRAMLRGYSRLRREGNIGLFRHIKSEITESRLPGIAESALPLVFGASIGNAERMVRQYLLERHIAAAMYRAVLLALGSNSKVVFPLPRTWQNVLIQHGLRVGTIRSSVAWGWILALHFGRNLLILCQMLVRILAAQRLAKPSGRYAYLDGLTARNLPHPDETGRSYDICSWYAQWEGRIGDIEEIRHNVQQAPTVVSRLRVEPMSLAPYFLLLGAMNIGRLATWCLVATLAACFDLLRGRWWHALLLAEAGRAKAVALTNRESLAADYLFHYSGSIYRPMWTYEAEKKGSRIVCYFYSTSEQPKLATGYESQKFEWGASSWPIFLVWDSYQEEVLRRDISDIPEIRVVGPIWFSTGHERFELPPRSVAVFDSEPHRLSLHFPQSTLSEYLAAYPDLHVQFLKDIKMVLQEAQLKMVLKRKREVGTRTRKLYLQGFRDVIKNGEIVVIPSSLSVDAVIKKCLGGISMPFTSTALILREHGLPSAYYDSTGWISPDDRAAHGIPVLVGIDALREWVFMHWGNFQTDERCN